MLKNPATKQGKFFRYKEDRIPIAIILSLSVLDFIVFFLVQDLWFFAIYYAIMILPKAIISAWNHHHQHLFTFRNESLNRGLEFFYALHTGVTTHLWRLHHVLGHHLNFLDQEKDESRWKHKDGSRMGVIYYTLNVAFTAYPRGFGVGKKYSKQQRTFLVFSLLCFVFVGVLLVIKPMAALFLFVLPMVTSLIFTAYATYGHHAGLDTEDEFAASYNNMNRLFNILTGNLGYHTAHHHKMGVHWSRLPTLHEKIKSKIPEELYRKSGLTKWLLGN